jgi:2-methylcitrate dehydratase PrpD
MMNEYSFSADDIEEVRAEVEPAGYHTITAVHAPSIYGKTVMAVAAVYGGRGFKETHQEVCYKSSRVASLEDRITILPKQDWDEHDHFRAVVTVTTKDGRTFRKEGDYRHMTEEDLSAKFADLAGLRAGEAKAMELAQVVKRLDSMDNIADLMVQLEMPEVLIEQV